MDIFTRASVEEGWLVAVMPTASGWSGVAAPGTLAKRFRRWDGEGAHEEGLVDYLQDTGKDFDDLGDCLAWVHEQVLSEAKARMDRSFREKKSNYSLEETTGWIRRLRHAARRNCGTRASRGRSR